MTWYHPKYYAALRAERRKLQAEVDKRAQPEVASTKPQAASDKRLSLQAPSDSKNFSKSSSDKQQAS
jgi:hypothetical protein